MTTITAKMIAHSVSAEDQVGLPTMQLRYPKCIHGEAKTHRIVNISGVEYEFLQGTSLMDDKNLSRNASSSRAIPVERLIEDVMTDPYIPIHWGKNQKGMQAYEECTELVGIPVGMIVEYFDREKAWLIARDKMVRVAEAFAKAGYHKQIVNRLLEPWAHINVLVTGTEWTNFFELRDHKDAMPEIQMLARAMQRCMAESEPRELKQGQWHTPYVDYRDGLSNREILEAIKISVARCARVSYLTQDGKTPSLESDLQLFAKLYLAEPAHLSPFEHQATPDQRKKGALGWRYEDWQYPHLHGNLRGWLQFRKTAERRQLTADIKSS